MQANGDGGATLYVTFYNGDTALETVECNRVLTGSNDWTRLFMTFRVPQQADKVRLHFGLNYARGAAYFDCLQLEEGDSVNPYNVVENADFSSNRAWSIANAASADGIRNKEMYLSGNVNTYKHAYQFVKVGKSGVAFHISARAKAKAAPNDLNKASGAVRFGLALRYTYADGSTETVYDYYNTSVTDGQKISFLAAPGQTKKNTEIESIAIFLIYDRQVNSVTFDEVMITVDESGTTYAYDEKGNFISSADNAKRQSSYTINDVDMITSITDSTGTSYSYTYHENHKKQLLSAKEESTGIGFEYVYGTGNDKANVTKVSMGQVGEMTDHKYIMTETVYTDNGAYVQEEINQQGKKITYNRNPSTGRVSSVTDPSGASVNYTYSSTSNKLTTVSSGTSQVRYSYSGAGYAYRLTTIQTATTAYNFAYDNFGNVSRITLSSGRNLVQYTYESGNGNLSQVSYGNSQKIYYLYDEYDRVIEKQALNSTASGVNTVATYVYNASGQLARIQDVVNARETEYSYDISGRLVYFQSNEGSIRYGYDNEDRITETEVEYAGRKYTSNYTYLSANRPGESNLFIGTVSREYDELQREAAHILTAEGSNAVIRSEALFYDLEQNRTTELISRYRNMLGGMPVRDYEYIYDERGNIRVVADVITGLEVMYFYDSLNQLVRENDRSRGVTILYTYDTAGNLLKKDIYNYKQGTQSPTTLKESIAYQYQLSSWKDLLTCYKNGNISYDTIGNPLIYYNGARFSWEQGRQLATVSYNGKNITYQYNSDGIRIGKNVDGEQTTYLVDVSGTIQALTRGNETLIFFYDSTGRREGFSYYDGESLIDNCYYIYNAQGDVTDIVNDGLNILVSYICNSSYLLGFRHHSRKSLLFFR